MSLFLWIFLRHEFNMINRTIFTSFIIADFWNSLLKAYLISWQWSVINTWDGAFWAFSSLVWLDHTNVTAEIVLLIFGVLLDTTNSFTFKWIRLNHRKSINISPIWTPVIIFTVSCAPLIKYHLICKCVVSDWS